MSFVEYTHIYIILSLKLDFRINSKMNTQI